MALLERITQRDDTSDPDFAADNQLVFRATFTADVNNVTVDDFIVTGTSGASVTSIEIVNNRNSQYDILVEGDNLSTFVGEVGIELAPTQNIVDASDGSAVPSSPPTVKNDSYTLDGGDPVDPTSPSILSIQRQAPTNAITDSDTLTFRVNFSEDVQSVDITDFVVNGGSTATVTTVTPVNGSSYDVTVSGGDLADFEGPVSLALAAQQDITNLANVAVPVAAPTGSNETYTVANVDETDSVAPILTSFERQTPALANTSADTLVFQATFNEGVQNVDATDFSISGDTTASVTEVVAISDSVYNVTVSGGNLATFNGAVGLDLSTAQDITDLAGNALPTGEPTTDEVYTVSNAEPGEPEQPELDGLLTPLGNVLEITRLASRESLQLNIEASEIITVGELTIYTTDAAGNNRTPIGSFSILEGEVLPAVYDPSFSLTDSDIDSGTLLQFEIVDDDVTRVATLSSTSDTEVILDFGDGTELSAELTTTTLANDLLLNDAAAIDLTGLTGTSQVTFTVYREAALNNTVGFYTTDFADGRIIVDDLTGATLRPGEDGYEEAALANSLDIELTGQNNQVSTFDATIVNGVFLGTYVIIDGVDPAAASEVLYSHQGANSGGFDQITQVGVNAFGIEDIAGGGDRDFNDMVVEFTVSPAVVV